MLFHPLRFGTVQHGLARLDTELGSRLHSVGGPFRANCYPVVANLNSCTSMQAQTHKKYKNGILEFSTIMKATKREGEKQACNLCGNYSVLIYQYNST